MTHKEKQLKQAEKELWRITNFSMSRYTDRQREMIDRIHEKIDKLKKEIEDEKTNIARN